jgi:excisionase family DNA binding protein
VTRPAPPPSDVASQLRALADRVDALTPAQVVGALEALKCEVIWTCAPNPAPVAAPVGSSRGLDVAEVANRTGMSKDWLYREVRAGRLPFAHRYGRRVVFDELELERWRARRAGQRRG